MTLRQRKKDWSTLTTATTCAVCGHPLPTRRVHVDTCRDACYHRQVTGQRHAHADPTTPTGGELPDRSTGAKRGAHE